MQDSDALHWGEGSLFVGGDDVNSYFPPHSRGGTSEWI
jgi:hypothetical protein